MNALTQAVKIFWNDEEGATAIEYSLLAALIALAMAAGAQVLGNGLSTRQHILP